MGYFNILAAIFLYLGWEYVGMEINNHRRSIAKPPQRLQVAAAGLSLP